MSSRGWVVLWSSHSEYLWYYMLAHTHAQMRLLFKHVLPAQTGGSHSNVNLLEGYDKILVKKLRLQESDEIQAKGLAQTHNIVNCHENKLQR